MLRQLRQTIQPSTVFSYAAPVFISVDMQLGTLNEGASDMDAFVAVDRHKQSHERTICHFACLSLNTVYIIYICTNKDLIGDSKWLMATGGWSN